MCFRDVEENRFRQEVARLKNVANFVNCDSPSRSWDGEKYESELVEA